MRCIVLQKPHNAHAGGATMKFRTIPDVHILINTVSYQAVVTFKCYTLTLHDYCNSQINS